MLCRLVILAALLSGCGDNIVGTPVVDFDAERDLARCERLVRCGLFAEAATCEGFFRLRPDVNLLSAIEAGVVGYDGVSASRCHAALAVMTCDSSARDARVPPLACTQIFSGSLATDASCAFDEECSSGSCDVPLCAELCCTGTCRAARPEAELDEACELDLDCTGNTFCGKDLICHALVAEAGLCEADSECDYGLGCIGPTELMAGNCRAMPAIGESCPYMRCAEIGAVCSAAHVCVAVGLPGSPCASDAECSPLAAAIPRPVRAPSCPRLASHACPHARAKPGATS